MVSTVIGFVPSDCAAWYCAEASDPRGVLNAVAGIAVVVCVLTRMTTNRGLLLFLASRAVRSTRDATTAIR